MAHAYGRFTGKPGVLCAQGIFAGSSGAFGIMESYRVGSPMVVITDISDQGSHGQYGSIDVRSIFRSMTKFTTYKTSYLGRMLRCIIRAWEAMPYMFVSWRGSGRRKSKIRQPGRQSVGDYPYWNWVVTWQIILAKR